MAGNPKGSPHRATPDAKRGTVNASFRVHRETNEIVAALAAELHDTKTAVADAMARVAARRKDEVAAELDRLRAAPAEKSEK